MPWMIVEQDSRYCIFKQDADGSPEGDSLGCHDTREAADEQLAALYASAPEDVGEAAALPVKTNDDDAIPAVHPYALKALNDSGRVGGYLVVWGSPQQRDLEGDYFTPETDLGLDWYDRRPALYHHGLDGTLKAAVIGVIDTLKTDDTGVWAEAQLDMRNRYVQMVQPLIDKGVLGWSSGSAPNLVEKAPDRRIKRWPIIEGSMTPAPAEPRQTDIRALKAIEGFDSIINLEELAAKAGLGDVSARDDESPVPPKNTQQKDFPMDIRKLIEAVVTAMGLEPLSEEQMNQVVATVEQMLTAEAPAPEAAMSAENVQAAFAKTAFLAQVMANVQQARGQQALEGTIKANIAGMIGHGGQSQAGGHRPANGAQITTQSVKYADMSAADMSFYAMIRRRTNMQKQLGAWQPDDEFLRELTHKSIKAHEQNRLALDSQALLAVKTIASQGAGAFKANELDHSTQATFGDEWVPDLWSSDLWRRARLDNVILPLFKTIDMPSNPYELPIEGADPTVYFVPETTNEDQLTLAASTNPIPDSKVGSNKVQLAAKKLALRVGFSSELEEDSIIPVLSIYREQADRAVLDAIDHVLLNGDDTNAGTGNINSDDADPADTQKYLAFNGILHSALVEDTTRRVDAGGAAPTLQLIRQMRFAMPAQYAQKPADLAYLVGGEVFAQLLNLDEFLTMDKIGNQATILNGMIGSIDGTPVLTSAEFGLAEADGKMSATPANNTLGRMATVFRPNWYVGYRRRIKTSVDFLPYYDSYQLTMTVRLAFVHQNDDSASVLYDLAV